MKFLLVILWTVSIIYFFGNIFMLIQNAINGNFFIDPLILALISLVVIALLVLYQIKANKTKRNIDSFSDISAKELQNRLEKLQSRTQKRIQKPL